MSGFVDDLGRRTEAAVSKAEAARGRLLALFDEGTFVESGMFVSQRSTDFLTEKLDTPADGVICGSGCVDGRLVYAYSQDSSVLGGSIGEMHAKKIEQIYANAVKMGAPVVGFIDSKGVRLNENVDALAAYGTVFAAMSAASGVVPQISVILGECVGGMSFIPALSDFVFMTEKSGMLFMSSPNSIPGSEGRSLSFDGLGSGKAHAEKSGLVHFVSKDEGEVLDSVKRLLEFLPSNNMDESPFMSVDEADGARPELDEMCDSEDIDALKVIAYVSDNGSFLEANKDFAKSVITGFARFNGMAVGVVANSNNHVFCNRCMSKAASFINFCDSFNIPLVTFTDVKGFKPSEAQEHNGIIKKGAALLHAFVSATVPKINVIIGNAFGSAYIVMNSKHTGADAVFAWPNAKISVMDADAAVNIMMAEELKAAADSIELRDQKIKEYNEMQSSPYTAASRGYIDAVIMPSATREAVSNALETLSAKRVLSPSRKHASF